MPNRYEPICWQADAARRNRPIEQIAFDRRRPCRAEEPRTRAAQNVKILGPSRINTRARDKVIPIREIPRAAGRNQRCQRRVARSRARVVHAGHGQRRLDQIRRKRNAHAFNRDPTRSRSRQRRVGGVAEVDAGKLWAVTRCKPEVRSRRSSVIRQRSPSRLVKSIAPVGRSPRGRRAFRAKDAHIRAHGIRLYGIVVEFEVGIAHR